MNGIGSSDHWSSSGGDFTYETMPTVTSLNPASVPQHGGVTVTITGTGFVDSTSLSCKFGSLIIDATYLTSTSVKCVSPALPQPENVNVEVSNNRVQFSSNSVSITYNELVFVEGLFPTNGAIAGGTVITISGSGFAGTMKCLIGGTEVAATVVSATSLTITAPSKASAGVVVVSVSSQEYGNVGTNLHFEYQANVAITSVIPLRGSLAGGTEIIIRGSNFVHTSSSLLRCAFSSSASGLLSISIAATFVDSSTIKCVTPTFASAGDLDVFVTTNGQDFVNNAAVIFKAIASLTITSLSPASSPAHSSSVITVTGTNFVNSNDLHCLFNEVLVSAIFVSSSSITCKTPAFPPGTVTLQVTNNFQQYDGASSTLTVYEQPRILSLSPSFGATTYNTQWVTIAGIGFLQTNFKVKVDGSVLADDKVEWQSSTSARFKKPDVSATGFTEYVVVEISNNAQDFTSQETLFRYIKIIDITSLEPAAGTVYGNTVITVHGAEFYYSVRLACKFVDASNAEIVVPATWKKSTEIVCVSPAQTVAHTSTVSVTNNGDVYSADTASFVYYNKPTVTSIYPTFGPLFGRSVVTVAGTNLNTGGTPAVKCAFGTEQVKATIVSATSITCIAPPVEKASSVAVEVQTYEGYWTSAGQTFGYVDVGVSKVDPPTGPIGGGTSVTVHGKGFQTPVFCKFGSATAVSATLTSSSIVVCTSPSIPSAQSVILEVSTSGTTADIFTDSRVQYTYTALPAVVSLDPNFGLATGGDRVTITGTNFQSLPSTRCKFDSTTVVPVRVTSTVVVCNSPAHASGSVAVEVSSNGQDYSGNTIQFLYVANPSVTSILPTAGPLGGATVVTVTGTGFKSSSRLQCKLGSILGIATFVSSTQITCRTPFQTSIGEQELEVSLNARHWTSNGVKFDYYPSPAVSGFKPPRGQTAGGTLLSVLGENFRSTSSLLKCKFDGTTEVTATYVHESLILCTTPADGAGVVDVEVTLNNQDYTSSGAQYRYTAPPPNPLLLHPSKGPVTGGTNVTITINAAATSYRYENSDLDLKCKFDGLPEAGIPAVFIDDINIVCVSPGHIAGSVAVSITSNDLEYDNVATFTYIDVPTITAVSPDHGPLAGAVVTITGTNFASPMHCRFGLIEVTATVASATSITCISPRAQMPGRVALEVSTTDVDSTSPDQYFGSSASKPSGWFYRYRDVQVTSVSPAFGPAAGGTVVTVHGSSFSVGTGAWCKFGILTDVAASSYTDTKVICTTPAMSDTSQQVVLAVEVTVNQIDYTSNSKPFKFYPDLTISSLIPTSGPASGNTDLTLVGTNFVNVSSLVCRFDGGTPVKAAYLKSTIMTCRTPAHAAGPVQIDISVNGIDFATNLKIFNYVADPVITSISPTVYSTLGGGWITLTGSGFIRTANFGCKVGSIRSTALFTDTTTAECLIPARAPGSVSVEVTNNGVHYSDNQNVLEYITLDVERRNYTQYQVSVLFPDPVVVHEIYPAFGTVAGGTEVTLAGEGFVFGFIKCKFGSNVVTASFTNTSSLVCLTPAAASAGDVDVSVSLDGTTFTNTEIVFTYYVSDPTVSSVATLSPVLLEDVTRAAITVIGTNFANTPRLSCMLGDYVVPANYISSTAVTCPSRVDYPGLISVYISNNMLDFSSTSALVTVAPRPSIRDVDPASGPVHGGLTLTIKGTAFGPLNADEFVCHFSAPLVTAGHAPMLAESPATFINDKEVTCQSPSFDGEELFARPAVQGTVTVTLSADGVVIPGSAPYIVLPNITVQSIHPTSGPISGGTYVEITVRNYVNGLNLCKFGSAAPVEGVLISATLIACVSPAVASSGAVSLEVSSDGVWYTSDTLQFTYVLPITVNGISPTSGGTAGGAIVTLSGANFLPSYLLNCRFFTHTVTSVPALWIDANQVLCVSPSAPEDRAGTAIVTVSNNGVDYAYPGVEYTYYASPAVTSANPTSVLTAGGVTLTVRGYNFENSATLACRFLDYNDDISYRSPATYVSVNTLTCVSPTIVEEHAGPYVLDVTNNGVDFSSSNINILFVVAPKVFSIDPQEGPDSGGTLVTITGAGFVSDSCCRFGGSATGAKGNFVVPLDVDSSTRGTCVSPARWARSVALEISLGGCLEFSNSNIQFVYHAFPQVSSVAPGFGWRSSTMRVTVTGQSFKKTSELRCRFGPLPQVAGTFYNSTTIFCPIPPVDAHTFTNLLAVSVVFVEVSQNARDFTSSLATFRFIPPTTLVSVSPKQVAVHEPVTITVTGSGFVDSPGVACRLDSTSLVRATYISSTTVECPMVAIEEGSVSIDITLNGLEYTSDSVTVTGYKLPKVSDVSPSYGPLHGKMVTVLGQNFRPSDRCFFRDDVGSLQTAISEYNQYVSSSEIRCMTPRAWTPVVSSLVVMNEYGKYRVPGVHFSYEKLPVLSRLHPSKISVARSAVWITVAGEHFIDRTELACRVGSTMVQAQWIDKNTVKCYVPTRNQPGFVEVRLLINRSPLPQTLISRTRFLCFNILSFSSKTCDVNCT